MDDIDIPTKLKRETLPYIVSAGRLSRWFPYYLYQTYQYGSEVFVLLASLGFSSPALTYLAESSSSDQQQRAAAMPSNIAEQLNESELYILIPAVLFLVAWGLVKFYILHKNLEKKCSLIESCGKEFQTLISELYGILGHANDPRDANTKAEIDQLNEKIRQIAQRHMAEGSWRFQPFAEGYEELSGQLFERLRRTYGQQWDDPQAPKIVETPTVRRAARSAAP
jgi:hypothetical protein